MPKRYLHTPSADHNRARRLAPFVGPLFAFFAALGLITVSTIWLRSIEDREAQAQFLARSQRITKDIEARTESFFVLTRAAAGLVDSRSPPTLAAWRDYVERVNPSRNWAGFRGMAVALAVPHGEEAAFDQARRRQGQTQFKVWRPSDAVRGELVVPITVMAPQSPRNDAIIGFDLGAEPRRAEAIRRARDYGAPMLTEPLALLNDDGGKEIALTLMAPIYANHTPRDVAGRRAAFVGVVVVGVGIESLLTAAAGGADVAGVHLRAGDQAGDLPLHPRRPEAGQTGRPPRFESLATLMIGGREWTLRFGSSAEFEAAIDRSNSTLVVAFGLLLGLVLALAVYHQGNLRRRAEARALEMTADLRSSESRFRLVAEAAGEGLWEYDFLGDDGFLSPRLVTGILGYPAEAFRRGGLRIADLIHPEDRERWHEARRHHIQSGAPYLVEYRIKCADGRWLWVQSRGKAEFDAHGHPQRMVGTIADISERKEHEEKRERQQRFLRAILDKLPEGVAVRSPGGAYVMVNQVYAERLGRPPEEIVGHTPHELFAPALAEAAVALDVEVAKDGVTRTVEQSGADARHPGEERRMIIAKILVKGVDDEPLVVGIHQDVTDLWRSQTRFRELSEMSSDWFWEQDAQLRFTELSFGLRTGGRSSTRSLGLHRWDLPIDWSAEEKAAHRALLEAHLPFSRLEYRIRDDEGKWRWYSVSGRPLFDAGGRFVGYRGTGTDISARKEVEEELRRHRDNLAAMVEERTAQLREAKDLAEAANHAKSEFLANMSHELRTPLHAILSFAHLGETRVDSAGVEKLAAYFSKIHSAGDRLLSLVNDVLDLSKLEAGKMLLHVAEHDLLAICREVATELEPLAEARQLRFELPPAEVCATARIDSGRFAQVLRNLYSNAIKFSQPHGHIAIEIAEATLIRGRRAADQEAPVPAWRITVSDEGVGLPEDELESVFDKFVQSSATRTGAGGTGLGLSICKEIVEAHRGQIRAYNRPAWQGRGAVFEILLAR